MSIKQHFPNIEGAIFFIFPFFLLNKILVFFIKARKLSKYAWKVHNTWAWKFKISLSISLCAKWFSSKCMCLKLFELLISHNGEFRIFLSICVRHSYSPRFYLWNVLAHSSYNWEMIAIKKIAFVSIGSNIKFLRVLLHIYCVSL